MFLTLPLSRVYTDGDFVCKEGDTGEEMYVLEKGTIDVYVGEIKVGTMEVGAVFGELSLIYGTKRTASCKVSQTQKPLPP